MVHSDQQHMLFVGEPDQTPAKQRTGLQIERLRGFFRGQTRQFLFAVAATTEIVLGEGKSCVLKDELYGVVLCEAEDSTQGLMSLQDLIKSLTKRDAVQIAGKPKTQRDVIGLTGAFHLG